MSSVVKSDIWNARDRSLGEMDYEAGMEEPARQSTSEFLEELSVSQVPTRKSRFEDVGDLRRRRRSRISSSAEIVQWNCVQIKPEIAKLVDASSDGILFTTDREYRVGTELLVRYPFPSSSSPKQKGTVVRVEELPDGRRQVAVRLE